MTWESLVKKVHKNVACYLHENINLSVFCGCRIFCVCETGYSNALCFFVGVQESMDSKVFLDKTETLEDQVNLELQVSCL